MNEKNYAMKETENMICAGEMNSISESLTDMMNTAACLSTDALVIAQCEYKGCPMCLSVIEGTVERVGEYGEKL